MYIFALMLYNFNVNSTYTPTGLAVNSALYYKNLWDFHVTS